ncbi:ATP-binding cassette domain-containing protein [Streptomyces sp. 549]|uniref:ATP-binding cassette domain-containing protein n=1 Tax=Streptomyces sp. 549 TaxID=3049076 RepID=UPI0024C392DA|nr:ATP-binding cassette domain-containing protein [Streptomyces sp. 549]MDK1472297.1 ATP-binding cassette domain-containing protein [Streptomyces sp. 549]
MVTVEGLCKDYGRRRALDGLDLEVRRGSVHGVLGPNGAGKTTAVRVLTTLLRPTSGTATVAGHDVVRKPDEVRCRIGLVGQHAAVDEQLSGRQNLDLFGRLHHLGGRAAARRAAELLELFELGDTGTLPVSGYSGGMRRRLDLAASLVTAPEVLFLDEPTTGLDPRGRTEVWNAVRTLVTGGTSVLLTTQYLEEADQLADHVSVLDRGRRVADGTPADLKARLGADHLDVVVRDAARLDAAAAALRAATGAAEVRTDHDRRLASAPVTDRTAALAATLRHLEAAGIGADGIDDIALRRPTLDEVFLHLTDRPDPGDRPDPSDRPDHSEEPSAA